jgi:hypothetical protein
LSFPTPEISSLLVLTSPKTPLPTLPSCTLHTTLYHNELTSSLAAAKLPNYERLITEAVKFGKEKGG